MTVQTWNDLTRNIDQHDYGSGVILEHGGIPPDTCIGYISNQFLAGIVNYLENKKAFIMNRYGLSDGRIMSRTDAVFHDLLQVPPLERYDFAAKFCANTHHLQTCRFDDTLIYGESKNSLYVLWFDCDSSDAFIWRFSKETFEDLTLTALIEAHQTDLRERYTDWMHDRKYYNPIIVEIPKINGWIT